MIIKYFIVCYIPFLFSQCNSVKKPSNVHNEISERHVKDTSIVTGAQQLHEYLPLIKNKKIGILANPTTIIGTRHLVDSLLDVGINIVKVFGPEHGFRGNASAGVKVVDEKDDKTGIKIISLYGKKRKPSADDMKDIDLIVFDIQDVGCRFYTYINVLRDIMEACAENNKPLIILDRPNPNGYLVDGPVLDMSLKSGIGQFPIPISHGMTIGEFAQMINGEKWLPNGMVCEVKVIKMKNYHHDMEYILPIKPSPNLNTPQSILLYPSICLFEGTVINLGRGTQYPFTVLGNPSLKSKFTFSYKPISIKGMSESPLHMNMDCYGLDLRNYDASHLKRERKINLSWLMELYRAYDNKKEFFDKSLSKEIGDFDKLAGTKELKNQIIQGVSEEVIRKSWEPELKKYKEMRKKYLLYD